LEVDDTLQSQAGVFILYTLTVINQKFAVLDRTSSTLPDYRHYVVHQDTRLYLEHPIARLRLALAER
jgi:hypothetical protein